MWQMSIKFWLLIGGSIHILSERISLMLRCSFFIHFSHLVRSILSQNKTLRGIREGFRTSAWIARFRICFRFMNSPRRNPLFSVRVGVTPVYTLLLSVCKMSFTRGRTPFFHHQLSCKWYYLKIAQSTDDILNNIITIVDIIRMNSSKNLENLSILC